MEKIPLHARACLSTKLSEPDIEHSQWVLSPQYHRTKYSCVKIMKNFREMVLESELPENI